MFGSCTNNLRPSSPYIWDTCLIRRGRRQRGTRRRDGWASDRCPPFLKLYSRNQRQVNRRTPHWFISCLSLLTYLYPWRRTPRKTEKYLHLHEDIFELHVTCWKSYVRQRKCYAVECDGVWTGNYNHKYVVFVPALPLPLPSFLSLFPSLTFPSLPSSYSPRSRAIP